MKFSMLLAIVFAAGCASSQNKSGKDLWTVADLDSYVLKVDSVSNHLKVDTIAGDGHVLIFERTVGRIEVDAGYMERLWIEFPEMKSLPIDLEIPAEGIMVFYERLCRCEYAGFHRINDGFLNLTISDNLTLVEGSIRLKLLEVTF